MQFTQNHYTQSLLLYYIYYICIYYLSERTVRLGLGHVHLHLLVIAAQVTVVILHTPQSEK